MVRLHDRAFHPERENDPFINDQEPPLNTMHLPEPSPNQQAAHTLALLESASPSPSQICEDDPEVKAAFEKGLRDLAEDILEFHPGLAHLLIGMSDSPCPTVHGQN